MSGTESHDKVITNSEFLYIPRLISFYDNYLIPCCFILSKIMIIRKAITNLTFFPNNKNYLEVICVLAIIQVYSQLQNVTN